MAGEKVSCRAERRIRIILASILFSLILMIPQTAQAAMDLSEEAVYQAIMAKQNEYYEGREWDNSDFYSWNGGIYGGGYGCAGFAFAMSDAAFGTLPARILEKKDFDSIRPGDVLRINDDSHSVIVLQKYSDYVVVAEGNYGGKIHWGRTLTKTSLENPDRTAYGSLTYIMTRYPEEHHYVEQSRSGNKVTLVCADCGKSLVITLPSDIEALFDEDGDDYYDENDSLSMQVGDVIPFWWYSATEYSDVAIEAEISNGSVATFAGGSTKVIGDWGQIEAVGSGTATLTVRSIYENNKVLFTIPITVESVILTDDNLVIGKKALTLFDTITIDFKVPEQALSGYHDPYLEVTQNGTTYEITKYVVREGYYIFTCRVAPHTLGDAVTAVPHALNADNADVTGVEFSYSAAEYCYNMLGNPKYQGEDQAKLRKLLVDILRYGDAAQVYKNYKVNELAGRNLTSQQLAMGTDVNATMTYHSVKDDHAAVVDAADEYACIEKAALYLEAAVNIQFKFTANSLSGLRVVVTNDKEGMSVIDEYGEDAIKTDKNGLYYVTFGALNAGQMRRTVYATVMQGDKKVSNTYCYSIESYVSSMKGKGGTNLDNLLDAMMRYGDSANSFVSK